MREKKSTNINSNATKLLTIMVSGFFCCLASSAPAALGSWSMTCQEMETTDQHVGTWMKGLIYKEFICGNHILILPVMEKYKFSVERVRHGSLLFTNISPEE